MFKQAITGLVALAAALTGLCGCSERRNDKAAVHQAAPHEAPARIEPRNTSGFRPTELEMGSVAWLSETPFELAFHNARTETVRISVVKASCGCTILDTSEYLDRVVAPGEDLLISGILHAGEKGGRKWREIHLMLDSGEVHVGTITYDVITTYAVTPASIDFGRIALDDPVASQATRRVQFRSDSVDLLGVARSDVAWIDAVPLQEKDAQGNTPIVLQLRHEYLIAGPSFGTVWFTTSDPHRPEFSISVSVVGAYDVRPVPAHVFARPGKVEELSLIGSNGEHVHVRAVRCNDVRVRARVSDDRRRVEIEVGEAFVDETARLIVDGMPESQCTVLVTGMGE